MFFDTRISLRMRTSASPGVRSACGLPGRDSGVVCWLASTGGAWRRSVAASGISLTFTERYSMVGILGNASSLLFPPPVACPGGMGGRFWC